MEIKKKCLKKRFDERNNNNLNNNNNTFNNNVVPMIIVVQDGSWSSIPKDLLLLICEIISDKEVIYLSHTCRKWNSILIDEQFWWQRCLNKSVCKRKQKKKKKEEESSLIIIFFSIHFFSLGLKPTNLKWREVSLMLLTSNGQCKLLFSSIGRELGKKFHFFQV